MAAHANRVLTRSAARTLVRLSAAVFLALIVCGAIMSLQWPVARGSIGNSGLSKSLLSGAAGWAADAVSGDAKDGEQSSGKHSLASGAGAAPGALMHQVCLLWC